MTVAKMHKQIANAFKVSVSTVRRRQTVRRYSHYTEEDKAEVLELLANGYTPAQISKLTDIPRTTIINWRTNKC